MNEFISRQQVLHLQIQFSRGGKEEVKNWRKRIRHPSVPVRFLSAPFPASLMRLQQIRPLAHLISSSVPGPRWQQALPLDRGFDPFGSPSEQMCSVASIRRHLHIFLDIQRSQHKGKKIFISLEVLVLGQIIQEAITGPVRTAY